MHVHITSSITFFHTLTVCICITGERLSPDIEMLMNGYDIYGCSGNTDVVFEFMLTYARRIRSDKEWTKILKNNPEKPFLCFITPSDIAFVQVLMMNGMGVWDQARRMKEDPTCTSAEKKELPVFTKGEGLKRESGRTVWDKDGLNFYYTAEKNWRKAYGDKDEFSDMCNKWEEWEPEKKSRKDPVRTLWIEAEENDRIEEASVDEWWERERMACDDVNDRPPEFYWKSSVRKGKSDDKEDEDVNDNE